MSTRTYASNSQIQEPHRTKDFPSIEVHSPGFTFEAVLDELSEITLIMTEIEDENSRVLSDGKSCTVTDRSSCTVSATYGGGKYYTTMEWSVPDDPRSTAFKKNITTWVRHGFTSQSKEIEVATRSRHRATAQATRETAHQIVTRMQTYGQSHIDNLLTFEHGKERLRQILQSDTPRRNLCKFVKRQLDTEMGEIVFRPA